jgi:hypothetical protein
MLLYLCWKCPKVTLSPYLFLSDSKSSTYPEDLNAAVIFLLLILCCRVVDIERCSFNQLIN